MQIFSRSIIGVLVLLLIETCVLVESNACYSCKKCPEPYNTNSASTVPANDDDYCYKYYVGIDGLNYVERGNAGSSCTPVGNSKFCCKGNLCNGNVPTAAVSSIVLGVALVSLFAYRSFF